MNNALKLMTKNSLKNAQFVGMMVLAAAVIVLFAEAFMKPPVSTFVVIYNALGVHLKTVGTVAFIGVTFPTAFQSHSDRY